MIFSNGSVSWDVGLRDATRAEAVRAHAPGGRPCGMPGGRSDGQRFFIECRTCGFEPERQESLPEHACPKCFSHVWHRVVRPGAMVAREAGATSTARLRRLSMVRRA